MKTHNDLLLILVFCFCLTGTLAAQPAVPPQDADRTDQFLIKKLKTETKKSESEIYQELGLSYFKQGNFDRSFMYFSKAVGLNQKAYWAHYYMGLMKLSNPEAYFKKAIAANQRFAPSYYWLGRYYCRINKPRESLKYLQDYLRLAKNDPEENSRIPIAAQFVELLKSGETNYDRIIGKIDTY